VLLQVQRDGESGALRLAGSTNRSKSAFSVGPRRGPFVTPAGPADPRPPRGSFRLDQFPTARRHHSPRRARHPRYLTDTAPAQHPRFGTGPQPPLAFVQVAGSQLMPLPDQIRSHDGAPFD